MNQDSQIRTGTIKNIKKQAQSLHKLIDQRVETLISEVNSAYDNRKRQREKNKDILELHHISLYSACDFAQELIVNATDSDVMVHAKSLIERLEEMEKTPVPSPDTPTQILYSQGKISTAGLIAMLGQVTVQSQRSLPGEGTNPTPHPHVFLEKAECVHSFSSKLKDDRKIAIHGLAIDMEQMFVVDNENNRTKMFTHAGEFKHNIEISSPFHVAVSQTGQPYITSVNDKYVKVFSTRGQPLATVGQDQLKEPWGITLNKQGHVMICDRGKKCILSFHADSGQLLNTIPLSMCECPEYITVNNVNDNIVISDWGSSCVHVLSPFGNQLYQYGTYCSGVGQMLISQGVCTDRYGHIFIADRDNNRIVALSPQGQFIRYIATHRDGMERPVALAINPADQLMVAERKGNVKTFQYLQ
ncbi:tripartite motif-containing protein 3-like [Lingula anatina]|uniref:Tripartite motif-containing protein 3-like n=1 Tax=Lingula anatina TaxID=7574 RepID=A0A1S3HDH7_LINAN|nr:tripartite motif-containing protein 3-like [Lingula anatina]|eukprot:XP_013384097.1 tripartite motif-containing protein 3-like [Lingula anatina]